MTLLVRPLNKLVDELHWLAKYYLASHDERYLRDISELASELMSRGFYAYYDSSHQALIVSKEPLTEGEPLGRFDT